MLWKIYTESMRGYTDDHIFIAKNIDDLRKKYIKRFNLGSWNDIIKIEYIGEITT